MTDSRPILAAKTRAHFVRIAFVLAGFGLSLTSAAPSYAEGAENSATFCDGTVQRISSLSLTVAAGDVINLVSGDVAVFDGAVPFNMLRSPASFTISAADAGKTLEFRVDGGAEISCRAGEGGGGAETTTSAAQASVTVQAVVTQSAITTNIAGRFGGAGFAAGPSNIFVSTRGLDTAIMQMGEPELNAWVAFDGRRFSGTATGNSRNVTFGVDRLVNPDLVIGGFVGVNDQTVTEAGVKTDTFAPLYGVYAARRFQDNVFLSGYFGMGQPKYTTGGTSFTAQRRILGLSLIGTYNWGNIALSPVSSVLASTEDLPAASGAADRLSNLQATFALRVQPQKRWANGMLPYISLGTEYRRQGSDLAGFDTFVKPRLGMGFDWKLERGTLRADLDYGAVTSGIDDLGISLIYDFKF